MECHWCLTKKEVFLIDPYNNKCGVLKCENCGAILNYKLSYKNHFEYSDIAREAALRWVNKQYYQMWEA